MSSPSPMPMQCDNQVSILIIGNSNFHEHTKHIEIHYHYIRDDVIFVVIYTPYVTSSHQLVDVFMKSLTGISYDTTYTKQGMFDLYAPAWWGLSDNGIRLSAHLETLIFTAYVLSFIYTILGFLALTINSAKTCIVKIRVCLHSKMIMLWVKKIVA